MLGMAGGVVGRLRRRISGSVRTRRGVDGASPGPAVAEASPLIPAPSGVPGRDRARWPVGLDGSRVDYAPDLDGDADPGEVVWAWVPFEEDPTQGKDRPVLVIGYRDQLLVAVQLTSKSHDGRTDADDWIEVGRGAWDSRGRVSYVDTSRLLTFIPSEIRREGAALAEDRFARVVARVAAVHGWS